MNKYQHLPHNNGLELRESILCDGGETKYTVCSHQNVKSQYNRISE